MRHDTAICAQKNLVKWSPGGLIMYPSIRNLVEPYLRDPDMEDTIYSLVTTVSANIICQYMTHA